MRLFPRLLRWLPALLTCAVAAAALDFDEYTQRAEAAKRRGDWQSAASQFAQALNHADLPKDGATRSTLHLEYGRAMGALCQFEEAEKYLLGAKALAEKSGSSPFPALYQLGAISVAQKKYPRAVDFLSQLVNLAEREPRRAVLRATVADAYEKLAVALEATGRMEEAVLRRRESEKMRDAGAKSPAPENLAPYAASCTAS